MTTPSPDHVCTCDTPDALLLRQCVLVLGSLLTVGLAAPVALLHMATRLRRPRHALLALGQVATFAVALVVALGTLRPAAWTVLTFAALTGIGVVCALLPDYRVARMLSGGNCVCATAVPSGPRVDAAAPRPVLV